MFDSVHQGMLPNNEQLVNSLKALRDSYDMNSVQVLLDPSTRQCWIDLSHFADSACQLIHEKNPNQEIQKMIYSANQLQCPPPIDFNLFVLLLLTNVDFVECLKEFVVIFNDCFAGFDRFASTESYAFETTKNWGSHSAPETFEPPELGTKISSVYSDIRKDPILSEPSKPPVSPPDTPKIPNVPLVPSSVPVSSAPIDIPEDPCPSPTISDICLDEKERKRLARKFVRLVKQIYQPSTAGLIDQFLESMSTLFSQPSSTSSSCEQDAYYSSFQSVMETLVSKDGKETALANLLLRIGVFHNHVLVDPRLHELFDSFCQYLQRLISSIKYDQPGDNVIELASLMSRARIHLNNLYAQDTCNAVAATDRFFGQLFDQPTISVFTEAMDSLKRSLYGSR
jgi:hypothetical protein